MRLPPPIGKKQKEAFGTMLAGELLKGNLNYHFRAIMVYEGYRMTPNLKKFSHIFEVGLFEFYRFNFISCLGIWFPLIEGIIRSFLGITFARDPKRDNLKNIQAKLSEYQPFLNSIIDCVLKFLSMSFFKSVEKLSDLPAHNFNRHFFSHMFLNEPFYCRNNCLKLLNLFDAFLAMDFIIDSHFKVFFDGTNQRIKIREQYYEQVVRDALSDLNLFKIDLLKDHQYFDEDFYFERR